MGSQMYWVKVLQSYSFCDIFDKKSIITVVAQAPDGKWYVLKNYSTSTTHTWTPASTGGYILQVKVRDSSTVEIKTFTLSVEA